MEVVPLHKVPTRAQAETIVKKLAADGKISLSTHCKERMRERGITTPQIFNCLLKGKVTEEPFLSYRSGGGYEIAMEKITAGDWLKVVVCIKFIEKLLVITAIN